jgi:ribose transport system substrate-binding protein
VTALIAGFERVGFQVSRNLRRENNMKGKVVFSIILVCLLIPVVSFAGGTKEPGEKTVVLLNIGMQSSYPPVYADNLEKHLNAAGIKMVMFDGKFDPQTQANQMNEAIALQPNAIVLFAVSSDAIAPGIKKAYDAGIPVIMGNTLPSKESEKYTAVYVGPNNYDEGKIGAECTNKILNGKGNVVIVEGAAGQETTIARTQGFIDNLDPGIKVLARQPADWTKDKAAAVMSDFITAYGKSIDSVWVHDDGMAAGVVIALQEAGYAPGVIKIVSLGGSKEGLKAVESGFIVNDILQSPVDETDMLAPFAIKIVNEGWKAGKQWDPYWNFMETPVITAENFKKYLPGDY